MKAVRVAAALAVVVAIAAYVVAQEKAKPWFDMEKCAMCSTLASKPGLLEAMTWEHFTVANGAVQVGHCPEEYKDAFGQAMAEMGKVQEKMQAGEKVYLDGYCSGYGELMMAGAKIENMQAAHSNVTLITSSDPKVIKKIHDFTNRTNEELAKMMAADESSEDEE